MWLSEHFNLIEFINSNEATRRGIDNTPPQQVVDNLTALCQNVLEAVRTQLNVPVRISSGYRSPALNRAIGGAQNSQHCLGQAADIEVPDMDNCDLARWIADNCTFDQLILEFHDHTAGPNSGWVHVSFDKDQENRRDILTASSVGGRTVYSRGFPW